MCQFYNLSDYIMYKVLASLVVVSHVLLLSFASSSKWSELTVDQFGDTSTLFSTPIWINDNVLAKQEIKKIRDLIKMEKKESPNGHVKSNIGGWQTSPGFYHKLIDHRIGIMELFRDVILRNVLEFVVQHEQILPFEVESKNIKYLEVWIDGGWANENGFQHFNMPHTHPESFIAGTFYLSKRNKGNLIIEDPRDGITGVERSVSIEPLKNRLVLFPSWLKHGVEPNPSEKYKRSSFSFNVQLNYLPDKMQSYQRESMFCTRNFNKLKLDCNLPNGRYFDISYSKNQNGNNAKSIDNKPLKLLWSSNFVLVNSLPNNNHNKINTCQSKLHTILPLSTNHTVFFRKKNVYYEPTVKGRLNGNSIISFVAFENIYNKNKSANSNIDSKIKMIISFKDARKMCSFGFRYTFGCPEGPYKTKLVELNHGQSIIFPTYLDFIIEPNYYKDVKIKFMHGVMCLDNTNVKSDKTKAVAGIKHGDEL